MCRPIQYLYLIVFEPVIHLLGSVWTCTILLEDDLLLFQLIILYGPKEFILKYANIKVRVHPPLYPTGIACTLARHTTPNHHRTPPILYLTFYILVCRAITRPSPYPLSSMRPKTLYNGLIRPNDMFSISCRPVLVSVYPVSMHLLLMWKESGFLLLASRLQSCLLQNTRNGIMTEVSPCLFS